MGRIRDVCLRLAAAGVLLAASAGHAAAVHGDQGRESRDTAGRNAGKEPVVTRKEAELLRKVAALAKTDRAAATRELRGNVTGESSAALDFALAIFLTREEKFEEAEASYVAATRKHPRFVRAWSNLGRLRLMRSKPQDAAAALREVIRHEAGGAEPWKLLGYSYLLADRLPAAESAYRQALALAPDDREVALGLAKTLLAGGRHAEALPLVKEQSAADPMNGDLWLLHANAHLLTGSEDRALEVLESARRLGVLGAEGMTTLADLYYNKGLYNEAVGRYDAAFETGKIKPRRMLRCAEALFHAGRIGDASRYLRRAQERGLKAPAEGWLLAGRIAEARKDVGAAKKAYETALETDPLNGDALLALGELHWRTEEYERAEMTFERASRVGGFEARALVLLGQMEVELDRLDEAIRHLEAAQEVRPSPRVRGYLEQLRRLASESGE